MAKYCSIDMDYRALYSSMIMCSFCNPLPSQNAAIIEAATGIKCDINEIKLFGERILTMKRLFNLKMGLSPSDERLPDILLKPLKSGDSKGKSPNFEKLRKLFYKFREWDLKSGKPKEEKLKALSLIYL
jgi:aldehyde:ferredoxin oxidoreductase